MSIATIATMDNNTAPIVPNTNQPAINAIPENNPSIPQFADTGMIHPFVLRASNRYRDCINGCLMFSKFES
jgi:hypothetical protein